MIPWLLILDYKGCQPNLVGQINKIIYHKIGRKVPTYLLAMAGIFDTLNSPFSFSDRIILSQIDQVILEKKCQNLVLAYTSFCPADNFIIQLVNFQKYSQSTYEILLNYRKDWAKFDFYRLIFLQDLQAGKTDFLFEKCCLGGD